MQLTETDLDVLFQTLKNTVPHVQDDIARDWLIESSQVVAQDIEDGYIDADHGAEYEALIQTLKWHIRRKKSFGASEMSALYTEFKGEWYPFGDVADIVRQKLCVEAVGHSNGDTARGHYHEPKAREMFIKQMKRQGIFLTPDNYSRKQISNLRFTGGIPGMEWMDCSPDDIFLDQDGKRYLVDYKCPAEESTITAMLSKVPDYYRAQLGQEVIILNHLGIEVDEIMLIPFSTKTMNVTPISCFVEDEMIQDIKDAGNHYWKCVQKGEFPRRPPSKDYEFVHQLPDELKRAVLEYVVHQKGKLLHTDEEKRAKGRMVDLMRQHRIDLDNPDKKVSIPMVDTRHQETRRFDQTAAIKKLKELGVDTDDDQFYNVTDSLVVTVNRSKSNRYSEIVEGVENFVMSRIAADRDDVVDDFQSKFAERDSVVMEVKPKRASKKAVSTSEPSF
jgi:hypothetical protein